MADWTQYLKILTTLLAIVNPLGIIPVFVSMTDNLTRQESKRIALASTRTVAAVLVVSTLIGKYILSFFGISIGSFKTGGGILLLLIAVSMMQGKYHQGRQTSEEAREAEDKESIAVVPIATPLRSGSWCDIHCHNFRPGIIPSNTYSVDSIKQFSSCFFGMGRLKCSKSYFKFDEQNCDQYCNEAYGIAPGGNIGRVHCRRIGAIAACSVEMTLIRKCPTRTTGII